MVFVNKLNSIPPDNKVCLTYTGKHTTLNCTTCFEASCQWCMSDKAPTTTFCFDGNPENCQPPFYIYDALDNCINGRKSLSAVTIGLIVGISVGFFILCFGLGLFYFCVYRKWKERQRVYVATIELEENEIPAHSALEQIIVSEAVQRRDSTLAIER